VGHNLGLIDEHFAEAAQDGKPGHAVELRSEDVSRFADICCCVIQQLDNKLVASIELLTCCRIFGPEVA
jgi:hypothetical protein